MNVFIPENLLQTLRKKVENLPKVIIKISFMEEKKERCRCNSCPSLCVWERKQDYLMMGGEQVITNVSLAVFSEGSICKEKQLLPMSIKMSS